MSWSQIASKNMPSSKDVDILEIVKYDRPDALMLHPTLDVLRAARVAKFQYTTIQATPSDQPSVMIPRNRLIEGVPVLGNLSKRLATSDVCPLRCLHDALC